MRTVPLESKPFATGGNVPINLDVLPADHRLLGILLNLPFLADQAAAAGAAVTAATLNRLIDMVTIGKRIRVTGSVLNALTWLLTGKDSSLLANVPAADGNYDRVLNLWVPFEDRYAYEPTDTAPLTQMFRNQPLNITFGSLAALGPTLSALTGTLFPVAVLEETTRGNIAPPIIMGFTDLSGKDGKLPAGDYTHLFAVKEDGSAITSAEVTDITVYVDGKTVIDRATVGQLAAIFNVRKALGGAVQALSETAPVPGEAISEQPGVAAGAGATISSQLLPLFQPAAGHKLTKTFDAKDSVRVKWNGSATDLRFGYRQVEEQGDDQVRRAAVKQGIPNPRELRVKTSSKQPVNPVAGRKLPKRVNIFTAG